MANANVNKVILGSETLIDLTEDTATEADVISGKSFHLRSGAPATGILPYIDGFEGAGLNGEVTEFLVNTNSIGYRVKADDFDDTVSSPSSAKYQDVFQVLDTNDHMIGFLEQYQETSGILGLGLATRKYINGSYVSNYLFANIANDGTLSYTVASPSAFRSAISAVSKSEVVLATENNGMASVRFSMTSANCPYIRFTDNSSNGYQLVVKGNGISYQTKTAGESTWPTVWQLEANDVSNHNASTKSIATATDTDLCNTGSLSAGTYIFKCNATFASNANGRRAIFLSKSSGGSVISRYARVIVPPVSGAVTQIQMVYMETITSATTFYLRGYQSSGGALNVSDAGIQVIKLHS